MFAVRPRRKDVAGEGAGADPIGMALEKTASAMSPTSSDVGESSGLPWRGLLALCACIIIHLQARWMLTCVMIDPQTRWGPT